MKIHFYSNIPDNIYYDLFCFEKKMFGNTYEICPQNYDIFCQKRKKDNIFGSVAYLNDKMISCNIYEVINKYHAHGIIAATINPFKKKGIFKQLCKLAMDRIVEKEFQYVSFWTKKKFMIWSSKNGHPVKLPLPI